MQFKKLVAGALGALMVGATAGMAATLADYPAPFAKDGNLESVIVVGGAARAADVVGAANLGARLAGESYELVSAGVGTVEGTSQEDIDLGDEIDNDLGSTFDDDDVSGLKDATVTAGETYDYHDEVVLDSDGGITLHTSLTASEDKYEDSVYWEIPKAAINYYYVFDETINVSDVVNDEGEMTIEFAGMELKITDVPAANKITVEVGQRVSLGHGESVEISGKTVTASRIGDSEVLVDVDGTTKTIADDATATVNGLSVKVDSTFNDDGTDNDLAVLIVGEDAEKTYTDGDAFVVPCSTGGDADCDDDNPDWVWELTNLATEAKGDTTEGSGGPTIGIKSDFVKDDHADGAPTVGDKIELPGGYVTLELAGLTVKDSSYVDVTVSYENSVDLSDASSGLTSAKVVQIKSDNGEEIFALNQSGDWISEALGSDETTDTLYLYITNDTSVNVYWVDSDNDVNLAGNVSINASATSEEEFGYIDFQDTTSGDVQLQLEKVGDVGAALGAGELINLTFDVINSDASEDIQMSWDNNGSDAFDSLGVTADDSEADEVMWDSTSLGTKDENHRTKYGIVIKDPDSNGASDKVSLSIPGDQVEGTFRISGTSAGASTSGDTKRVVPVKTAIAKLDTDAATDVTAKNAVLVGGPCANTLVQQLAANEKLKRTSGNTTIDLTCTGWKQTGENFGIIAVVDDAFTSGKAALVVAGSTATETTLGTQILQDYESFADKLKGNMVEFSGTSVSSVTFVE